MKRIKNVRFVLSFSTGFNDELFTTTPPMKLTRAYTLMSLSCVILFMQTRSRRYFLTSCKSEYPRVGVRAECRRIFRNVERANNDDVLQCVFFLV